MCVGYVRALREQVNYSPVTSIPRFLINFYIFARISLRPFEPRTCLRYRCALFWRFVHADNVTLVERLKIYGFMVRTLIRSSFTAILFLALLCPQFAVAAASESSSVDPSSDPSADPSPDYGKADKRIFGVLPNYRSVEGSVPFSPLSPRQKLGIAARDSFDWPTFLVTGAFAGIYQAENQNPAFGQGIAGYTKRYSTALADQMIGNMMTEGFLPVLLHDDTRFFRNGSGTTGSRLKSALRQIVMIRTDSGSWRFNAPEWFGNGIGVGISNVYYTNSRTLGDNLQRYGMQIGTDALSNVLKEFWPDIKQRFFQKKAQKA